MRLLECAGRLLSGGLRPRTIIRGISPKSTKASYVHRYSLKFSAYGKGPHMPTLWSVEILKSYGSIDPTRAWANVYELLTPTDVGPAAVQPAADILVAAEKAIHLTTVNFLQYSITPWHLTPTGYDPLNQQTVAISGAGSRTRGTDQTVDLNTCYMIRFTPAGGRTGRRFYRGCLIEGDLDASNSGANVLVGTSTLYAGQPAYQSFVTQLAPVLPGGAQAAKLYMLATLKSGVFHSRPINAIGAPGVVYNKKNHKWFNRKKPVQ